MFNVNIVAIELLHSLIACTTILVENPWMWWLRGWSLTTLRLEGRAALSVVYKKCSKTVGRKLWLSCVCQCRYVKRQWWVGWVKFWVSFRTVRLWYATAVRSPGGERNCLVQSSTAYGCQRRWYQLTEYLWMEYLGQWDLRSATHLSPGRGFSPRLRYWSDGCGWSQRECGVLMWFEEFFWSGLHWQSRSWYRFI